MFFARRDRGHAHAFPSAPLPCQLSGGIDEEDNRPRGLAVSRHRGSKRCRRIGRRRASPSAGGSGSCSIPRSAFLCSPPRRNGSIRRAPRCRGSSRLRRKRRREAEPAVAPQPELRRRAVRLVQQSEQRPGRRDDLRFGRHLRPRRDPGQRPVLQVDRDRGRRPAAGRRGQPGHPRRAGGEQGSGRRWPGRSSASAGRRGGCSSRRRRRW